MMPKSIASNNLCCLRAMLEYDPEITYHIPLPILFEAYKGIWTIIHS